MSAAREQAVNRTHRPLIARQRSRRRGGAVHIDLKIGNGQTRQLRPGNLQFRLIDALAHIERRIDKCIGHRLQHRGYVGIALGIQIETVGQAVETGPNRHELAAAIRSHHRLQLAADGRGVDQQFATNERAVAVDILAEHALAGTILAQAGPNDKKLLVERRNFRRVLVAERVRIDPHHRAAGAGAGVRPRVNVPTVRQRRHVQRRPGNQETAVRRRGQLRRSAGIGILVHQKFTTNG